MELVRTSIQYGRTGFASAMMNFSLSDEESSGGRVGDYRYLLFCCHQTSTVLCIPVYSGMWCTGEAV